MDPSGALQFQDYPCEEGTKESALATDYDKRGFLKKWFRIPSGSARPICEKNVCKCGEEKVTFFDLQGSAVVKTVDGLINAWDSYKSLEKDVSRERRRSAACRVRIHQKAFNISYERYTQKDNQNQRSLKKAQEEKESCNEDRNQKREAKIKKLMSPPYNQSRQLAVRNVPIRTHMGNPCDKAYRKSTDSLPVSYRHSSMSKRGEVYATIERLK